VTWGDPTLYDLTLNTERISIPACVDQVVELAKSAEFQETPESRQFVQDLALQAKALAALKADPRTAGIDISVDVVKGRVALRGIVVDDSEKALVREVLQSLPGVAAVVDELRTMAGGLYRFPSQLKDKG
jgi:osmotically-inducible protein OsmY